MYFLSIFFCYHASFYSCFVCVCFVHSLLLCNWLMRFTSSHCIFINEIRFHVFPLPPISCVRFSLSALHPWPIPFPYLYSLPLMSYSHFFPRKPFASIRRFNVYADFAIKNLFFQLQSFVFAFNFMANHSSWLCFRSLPLARLYTHILQYHIVEYLRAEHTQTQKKDHDDSVKV